ncbi:ArsB/NhaD family transporter [Bacillus sp. WP8]|nr:ArsB/NhaD family transporter [Bacillus sp. WP8]
MDGIAIGDRDTGGVMREGVIYGNVMGWNVGGKMRGIG